MPPMYWLTGSHASTAVRSVGRDSSQGPVNRADSQDEPTKVSVVLAPGVAIPPQRGQTTCFQVGWRSSGLPGRSNSTSSGNVTGNSSSGTGTTPHDAQWRIGIGQP